MNSSVKYVRTIHTLLLCSIALYVLVGEEVVRTHPRVAPGASMYYIFTIAGVAMVLSTFAVRMLLVKKAEAGLARDPANPALLHRWRGGYIVSYAFSEIVAVFGFVLRLLGFSLSQVASFYVAGLLLLVFMRPRRQAANSAAPDGSAAPATDMR
jgi:F0F1-type ATP synthase membrane subunit c/vacuolar-type H+-ATPase subunit K